MPKYIIGIILLFFSLQLFANKETDSLINELSNRNEVKEQTLLLNKLSKSYAQTNSDSAIYFAKKGLSLSQEIEYNL
jgi:hypothetical protein